MRGKKTDIAAGNLCIENFQKKALQYGIAQIFQLCIFQNNYMFTVLARNSTVPLPAQIVACPRHGATAFSPWVSKIESVSRTPTRSENLAEHALIDRSRRRSLGFVDWEKETWSCFLVTFVGRDGQWHGHLAFRPQDGDGKSDEVCTADIFIEASEAEIDHKARGLGRPLFRALLSSSLHTSQGAEVRQCPKSRRWFENLLLENSKELSDSAEARLDEERREDAAGNLDSVELRSLYQSYRLDQVCHFITLVDPDSFEAAVDSILEGQRVDFGAKDRLQLGMLVIEYIGARIPMPPFAVWVEDFLANREEYMMYTHTLHRERRLP